MSGYETAEVCPVQPELLSPGTAQMTRLYVATNTPKSLVIDVHQSDGTYIPNAAVRLYASSTDKTILTSLCGQVYFPGLTGGTYSVYITKTGFQNKSASTTITTDTRTSYVLTP
jgi:DNA gyrase inhibitor GyrI